MAEWRPIDKICNNCGVQLEAIPRFNVTSIIEGNEPMDYRHIGGEKQCHLPPQHAQPFSTWGSFSDWKTRGEA